MLATVISQYLQVNRRLIVPQLGAFLVKEPEHKVLFSTLLTHDDGLLRELLMAQGMSEVEASGLIDRFLFDIRFALENSQGFTLDGVGRFRGGENGTILFEAFAIKPILEPVKPQVQPQTEQTPPTEQAEQATPQEAPTPTPTEQTTEEDDDAKIFEADPDLEEFVYHQEGQKTKHRPGRSHTSKRTKSGRVDLWLIIGMLAIVLAVGAILYGFLREGADNSAIMSLFGQVITK